VTRVQPPQTGSPGRPVAGPFEPLAGVFAGFLGLLLMAALIQWGNPVVLDDPAIGRINTLTPTGNPSSNARYWALAAIALLGFTLARKPGGPRWILFLPLVWLGWQFLSATTTVDGRLTRATLKHFTACVACFYLGLLALRRARLLPFTLPVIAGFLFAVWVGFDQHYGGLEDLRQFYDKLYRGELPPEIQRQYDTPQMRELFGRPEFQKRLASNRIFGTLVYPNALASAVLLILPMGFTTLCQLTRRFPFVVGGVVVGIFSYAALACLYWSGSKSGWLIGLLMAAVVLWRLPMSRRTKLLILALGTAAGLILFFARFSDYFRRGATSVEARFDYWKAALHVAIAKPILGSGPGTFSTEYRRIRSAESEMARLAHNDFLEQASDSGWPGFAAYLTLISGTLGVLYRQSTSNPLRFATWIGLFGWFLHGLVEFGLYIPALAWLAFTLLGWLWGTAWNEIDIKSTPE
jgi:hypothetical protein